LLHEINSMNTKRALASSLKSLFRSHEPGKNITVSEIVRSAGANRNTFYYHFADVQALILWTLNDDVFARIREHDPADGAAIREIIVDYMYDNAKFLNFAYHYIGFDAFNDHYVDALNPIILRYIESVCARRGWRLDERQKKFINGFFAEQVGSLYLLQFRKPNRFPKDSARKYLELIFDYVLPGVVEHASDHEMS
jgi:AcrR family transcriptional regulator